MKSGALRIALPLTALLGCEPSSPPKTGAPPPRTDAGTAPSADGRHAFERLSERLDGTWVGDASGHATTVRYRSASGKTALVESFVSQNDRETLTMLHPDGNSLLLTHYCAQGNQARLRATEISEQRVVFSFVDATNVLPGQAVLSSLTFAWTQGGVDRTEVYRQPDGKLETTVLHLKRAPHAEATPSVVQSVGELRIGDRPVCSAVRVGRNLFVSAAHCATGFDGKGNESRFRWASTDGTYDVERAEMGRFSPAENELHDWMILRGKDLPTGLAARLATAADLARARHVGDALDDRSVPLVVVSFPERATRVLPRPPIPGNGVFVSSGFVKSARAYREATLLTANGTIYDDLVSRRMPPASWDVDRQWTTLSREAVFRIFEGYGTIENAVLYHSADYASGSGGGGAFAESERLLGIIPYGASPNGVSRAQTYPGFGQVFAIDAICKESRVLRDSGACEGVESTAPSK